MPRELFVPESRRDVALRRTRALPIGHGQTISQPFMVATICALLGLRGDERVLDVGTGSGYQAAVLAELAARGASRSSASPSSPSRRARTLAQAGYERVEVRVGDGTLGVPERAPFEGIAVAAAAPRRARRRCTSSSSEGGRLVVPGRRAGATSGCSSIVRAPEGPEVAARPVPCRFVPLLGAAGFGVSRA